ncbi:twin arginine-targeting protein translocase TatB [Vibrio genomosp. F10 str. ZF-129]|uniref:Sec-independent protein translocase protein TatB n=1 Tax=Vibrio genomosp. F10 str. ZF-129 TaxID=1187848 RepID=A0A1E5BJI6_9VIBR|nr:Sec-independent protein translocase protein TatB [Vibrio genomosp. F10]OEE37188.1 twin arginine-targeting protein translocase TatB [Vibrio genomosp. F10 str. ZF-129]
MFDIGFWELVLISVVGLVVLGPERLPHAIRSVTKFIGAAKSMANNVKDELNHELKIQELQDNLRKAEKMGMEDLSPELKSSVEELKQAAQDVQRPYANHAEPENPDLANADTATKEPISAESVTGVQDTTADKKAE